MNQSTPIDNWQNFVPPANAFVGKVSLVTGAADGIGRALTLALAKHGATVLMLDKKARHLEKLYDSITEQGFAEPVILPVDLEEMTPESATQIAQAVQTDFGHLDHLIHNAAELGSPSPLDQYDMSYWQKVMQINLQAPYLLTRALLPLLKKDFATQILFTSAEVGRVPKAYGGAYAIAYAGIEAQMTIWAEELENTTQIRVNSIDPGPVRTVLRRRSHPGEDQGGLRTPGQVVPAYLKVLSASSYDTALKFKA